MITGSRPAAAAASLSPATQDLASGILAGQRRALARAITLVESTRSDHRLQAARLIAHLLPATGKAIRIGFSGPPGVGKSTFIEAFGTHLTRSGRKVAVLAVDPSSSRSGGSILGDKTRMETLSREPNAYIRPSPSGGTLGGVARRTREAMLLAEAAGFDVIFIETVGVGQSETTVADMVDLFVLLASPAGGDDLQGIKRGIMELADLLIVTKADGDLLLAAQRAASELRSALHLMRPKVPCWRPKVLTVSSVAAKGLETVWDTIEAFRSAMDGAGELARLRAEQSRAALWREIEDGLITALKDHPQVAAEAPALEARVVAGETTPSLAAEQLLTAFLGRPFRPD
ncbi:methylmalonyl Co-A mutase-associated GTPase MeaB [Zavarzinia compransoris]|uniref:Methylmalonyl Co-A mutase-associated GTPase MeaB n=1 Tax=Zavarzinia compransoris TaxID=1264899 RepID=A0A317EB73_9PROT|nr:methylmalonyl Co-A mutase-associated GTPase MeaB [Zavarzinia compransoris]PWR23961.1 methylmalonyl Co-A mutase-associated GTPase MeaB [Zavarzinia compransoris]TDP48211.1 methylmalonyl-CoA mutase metallochaperone MeaB [Zavarzinia compransoris]